MDRAGEDEESNLIAEMNEIFKTGDNRQRRDLFRKIVILLYTSSSFPSHFVQAEGIKLLILATRDPEAQIRLLAVHALSRLVERGYRTQVQLAEAEKELYRMRTDPYQPLREFADRCLSTISEPDS